MNNKYTQDMQATIERQAQEISALKAQVEQVNQWRSDALESNKQLSEMWAAKVAELEALQPVAERVQPGAERNAALEEAAKICESLFQYPGVESAVDGNLPDAVEAIRALVSVSVAPSERVQTVAVPEAAVDRLIKAWADCNSNDHDIQQERIAAKSELLSMLASPSAPAVQVQEVAQNNPLAHTWPAEIFLQVGDCDRDAGLSYNDARQGEITWCAESIDKGDVRYVRAALAAAPTAQPAAPVAYADPQAFVNFDRVRTGDVTHHTARHEWMWALPSAGLVSMYLAQPSAPDAQDAVDAAQWMPGDQQFEGWCERHDMRSDRDDHRQMFDDAASMYLDAARATKEAAQ